MNRISQIFILLLTIYLPLLAVDPSKERLEPIALLNRCYSHFTQKKISRSHPLYEAVAKGYSPVKACMSLFDKATLNESGPNEGQMVHTTDPDALSIIKTMDIFHRTWFPNNDFVLSSNCGEFCQGQAKLFDSTEPSLHLTRALFGRAISFSEIVTSNLSVEALRTSGPIKNSELSTPFTSQIPRSLEKKVIETELVQKGQLIGVRHLNLNPNKTGVMVFNDSPNPLQVHESLGGGILGTKPYLMLNFGRDWDEKSDGGRILPRRWAQAVFSDLLCRSLPAIRSTDAKFYVTPKETPSTPPFRLAKGCMSCHVSMDYVASVARNLSITLVPIRADGASAQVRQWSVTLPPELGLVNTDPDFFSRPPRGRLIFRSYNGTLIQHTVNGFKELGAALSQTDDLYVCAASRYFQFFTGVTVNLQDSGDPASLPLSQSATYYRNEVIKLGTELKKHQSLRTLVEQILETPTYQATGQRPY